MRLLLVEDERKVASFIARALRENSYAVDVAESGEKAMELIAPIRQEFNDAMFLGVSRPSLLAAAKFLSRSLQIVNGHFP